MATIRRPAAETGRLAERIYERDIRQHVEGVHDGEYVAIDVDGGHWVRTADRLDAARRLREDQPDAVNVYVMRVGYRAVDSIGGRLLPTPSVSSATWKQPPRSTM